MARVLNIIDSLGAGGAESLVKNFVIEINKSGDFIVDVCALYFSSFYSDELAKRGVKVYCLNIKFKYDFLCILKLIKIIKNGNYDIVHVHLFPADLFASVASVFLSNRIKFIFSEHNVYNRRRSLIIYKPVDCFVYSRYKVIVCVSRLVKEALNKYLPFTKRKSVIINNAVEIKDYSYHEKKIYDLLFVGRLEYAKGVDLLIKAMKLLKYDLNIKIKLCIVGEGRLKTSLLKLAEELKVADSVEFLGTRKDIEKLMRKSKVFVLPSRWEGLPMVILEAMTNGLPVIATRVGGIVEVIENGEDGIVVESDNPEELANAIAKLMSDETLRLTISTKAYNKVRHEYSIEKYTGELIKLYKEVL